jgi:hypothetical protein
MKTIKYLCITLVSTAVMFLQGCGGGSSTNETSIANFTGTWSGSILGTNLVYVITQSGNNIDITRNSPALDGLANRGVVTGNVADVTTYINGVNSGGATWTLNSPASMAVVVTRCNPPAGYSCATPGTTIILNKN